MISRLTILATNILGKVLYRVSNLRASPPPSVSPPHLASPAVPIRQLDLVKTGHGGICRTTMPNMKGFDQYPEYQFDPRGLPYRTAPHPGPQYHVTTNPGQIADPVMQQHHPLS